MKYSYSVIQMREADTAAIKSGITAQELMERVGHALAQTVLCAMQKTGIDDALFVCGGGNNGGDGFVAARILLEKGKEVAVLCAATKFTDECKSAKESFYGEIYGVMPRRRYALIVDCLFGTGLSREPEGNEAALIDFINHSGAYVVSCDMPSGLSENGIAFSHCVRANETLAIGQIKNALYLADGADVSGGIAVADIGIPARSRGVEIWGQEDIKPFFPKRRSHSHKGDYGDATVLAGNSYSGAAFLAAGACLKSGVGYTRLRVPESLYPFAVGKLPACLLKEYNAPDGEMLASACIATGMGAGVSEQYFELLTELVTGYTGTLILDADALNTLSLFGVELLKEKACQIIVTPHVGEFARLTKKSSQDVLNNCVSYAEDFAKEFGVTVVLKNNRTVIANGERVAISVSGSPALAKGGSGDVLSGFMAGTAARGVPCFEAACIACNLVGNAGEYAAHEMGEYAPDATDIIAYLPKVMSDILS